MLSDGEAFRDYLKVQGRFDRYSVTNAVLVSAQMPNATKLKDYRKWRSERVYVYKGANKVVILEPGKEYIMLPQGETAVVVACSAINNLLLRI